MNKDEICWLPAFQMADMVRRQEITALELTELLIERIGKINPVINAYCTPTFDLAKEMAQKADTMAKAGVEAAPLLGVPTSIKDLSLTKGIRTTYGGKLWEDFIPEQDEEMVKRLKMAGCVILGKTNTPEMGHMAVTDNMIFGRSNNPWDLERTTGGSSGGAAAACVCGISPLAQGSDGGGSIRIPSCFCGVYGLKSSYGRVPRYPYEGMEYRYLDHYGPITRYVKDAALMLDAMKGPHPGDRYSLAYEDVSYFHVLDEKPLPSKLKIGYWPNLGFVKLVDSEVTSIVTSAVNKFTQLDWTVEEVKKRRIRSPENAYTYLVTALLAHDYYKKLDKNRDIISPNLVKLIEAGKDVGGMDLLGAFYKKETLYEDFRKFFEEYDIMVTPTLCVPAFEHGQMFPPEINGKSASPLGWMSFTYPFNMTGLPAASIPAGFTSGGLPVGMQIIGPNWADLLVLQVSLGFESVAPWQDKHPNLP